VWWEVWILRLERVDCRGLEKSMHEMMLMRDAIGHVRPITSLICQSSCIRNCMLAPRHQDVGVYVADLKFSYKAPPFSYKVSK